MGFYERWYPEMMAGGFSRHDHDFLFYARLNTLLKPGATVLDLGAGRGESVTNGPIGRAGMKRLKDRCAKVVGADVDPAVEENPHIDEAHVIDPSEPLPFADASFDMVHSYAVFEHVAEPKPFASEIARVLAPGGWLCAWTPNKWGYAGIATRLVPNRFHATVLKATGQIGAEGQRKEKDVFPTVFKLNTRAALRKFFPAAQFSDASFAHGGPPVYTGGYLIPAWIFAAWEWLAPEGMRRAWHVFMQKNGVAA